jgi:hypothetical protein
MQLRTYSIWLMSFLVMLMRLFRDLLTLFTGVLLDDVYKSIDGGEHWQKTNIARRRDLCGAVRQLTVPPRWLLRSTTKEHHE